MQEDTHDVAADQISRRVRTNALPAAIAAALMIYFGYYQFFADQGGGLRGLAGGVFVWTLRIGGISMALIAVWCMMGHLLALAVDGIVSVTIGVLLALTGIGLLISNQDATQLIINCVCAWLFIGAGMRNWREYRLLSGKEARPIDDQPPTYDLRFQEKYDQSRTAPPPASLASQLRDRAETQAGVAVRDDAGLAAPAPGPAGIDDADDASGIVAEPGPLPPPHPEPTDWSVEQGREEYAPEETPAASISLEEPDDTSDEYPGDGPHDDVPPPDGFLSSFADDDSPRGL